MAKKIRDGLDTDFAGYPAQLNSGYRYPTRPDTGSGFIIVQFF
jgi:hypothetical protein